MKDVYVHCLQWQSGVMQFHVSFSASIMLTTAKQKPQKHVDHKDERLDMQLALITHKHIQEMQLLHLNTGSHVPYPPK